MKHFITNQEVKSLTTNQAIKPSSTNQVMKQANKQMNASPSQFEHYTTKQSKDQQDQLGFTFQLNLIKIAPSPTISNSLNSLSKNTTYSMDQTDVIKS